MCRRRATAVFTGLTWIIFSQNSQSTGGWDSPDACLYKDLQMAGCSHSSFLAETSLLRAGQSLEAVWSYLPFLSPWLQQHVVPLSWEQTAQYNQLPLAGLSDDRRLWQAVKWSASNKNTFATESRRGKTENKENLNQVIPKLLLL